MSPRLKIAITTVATLTLISFPVFLKSGQFLIWNASASFPIGL
jgi:type IV secretory pathway protease TraF